MVRLSPRLFLVGTPMPDLNPHDPRNPRIQLSCPRCALSLTYLGTFPEPTRAWPWEELSQQILSADNTHVYACIEHGRFWLNDAVGLKAEQRPEKSQLGNTSVTRTGTHTAPDA